MNSGMESAAVDATFPDAVLMYNCFELPQNETTAVFYYFAMYRPFTNILQLEKAIFLCSTIDCFITVSNCNKDFNIFMISYFKKKYIKSLSSREGHFTFFSSAFYAVKKEKP